MEAELGARPMDPGQQGEGDRSAARTSSKSAMPTAVLASGNGTNLQAVIDATRAGALPLDLIVVVSNKPGAFALERAANAGIPKLVLTFDKNRESRRDYGTRLAQDLRKRGVRLVLLLGWMHVLATEFLEAGFDGVLNLHPAYLPEDPAADAVQFPDGTTTPAFRGPRALRDAIAARARYTGASLIQITHRVDRGPLLARKAMRLFPEEDEEAALRRLHAVEQDVVREGVLRWIEEHPA